MGHWGWWKGPGGPLSLSCQVSSRLVGRRKQRFAGSCVAGEVSWGEMAGDPMRTDAGRGPCVQWNAGSSLPTERGAC